MKRLLLLTSIVILLCQLGTAQFGEFGGGGPKIKGKITGTVVDSLTNVEVGFATISLKREGRDKVINGTLSEDDGKFSFTDITPGKYEIEVSFLGYDAKVIRGIETTKKKPDYDIGSVLLASTDYLLDEVQITEKRSLFENKVDRIVFNAEDDSSVAGGDATDVLRKVPNLSVDLDGNVSIRGSSNIRILINGKPSGMFSSNVADALKMFPADQIKRVEVITSPGAKYDGEGSGGIINIVTKKANVEGIAGTLNGSLGNRQSNASANLNMGKGRFGSTINGSLFYSLPADGTFTFARSEFVNGGTTSLTQDGVTNTSRLGFRGTASAFYDFNAYNAINSSFSLRGFGFDTDGTSTGRLIGVTGEEIYSFTNNTIGDNLNQGFDWNTDYTRKFEANEQQELVIAYQLSKGDQDTDNSVDGFGTIEQFLRNELINNIGENLENTLQIDYVQPLPKSMKLEVGTKGVLRDISSDSKFTDISGGNGGVIDEARSNIFNYDQDVLAGYAQVNFVIGKLQFITGMRYERTDIAGAFEDVDLDLDFENTYDNWLPSFTVSRGLSNFRNLKFSYSKRIQRPSLFNINPFYDVTDLTNVRVGNPLLNPEVTNQYEVSYNTRVAGFNIFGSTYYKRTNDIIEQILTIENAVSINTFDNVGTNNSFGVNMFVNKTINKFNIRFGGDVFTYDATGVVNGEARSNSAVNYQIFTNGEYSITGTLKADFFGFFRSDQPTLQGSTPSFSIFGIGVRKDIKSLSLGIRIIEPFSANKEFNTSQTGSTFEQVSGFSIPFRSIGVNVRYKFGKVDFKERRSKIKNTDQKGGGDQQGQGGGQGVG